MLHRFRVLATFALTLLSVPALAHDMWIEPSTFLPVPGDIVPIRLRVGQKLLGDPIPRDPQLVKDFVIEQGRVRTPVVGRDGGDPAGFVRPTAGLAVVGYQSHPSRLTWTRASSINPWRMKGSPRLSPSACAST